MNRAVAALLLATICTGTWSQGDAGGENPGGVAAERARIDAIRVQKTAEFDADDAACLSRFAVTDCQSAVGRQRRQMLDELKRREGALNAAQRRQKGDDQLQRSEEKAVENIQRGLDAQATADKTVQEEDRQKAQDDKRKAHQEQAQPVGNRAPANKSSSVLSAQEIEKNRQAYLEKQRALEKRRQERDQRVLDHGKGGPPLPSPP